jgi:ABC-type nitrate/sulfonate/bicarbonate transport system permease component
MVTNCITKLNIPMIKLFTPFHNRLSKPNNYVIIFWLVFLIGFWGLNSFNDVKIFPTIGDTVNGLVSLFNEGLVQHIASTLYLCLKSTLIAVVVSLVFSYLSVIPFFQPLAKFISKFRYLPLTGITFYITMLLSDARTIQVWILVVFTSTYLITSLISMISSIDEEEINHARSLGCSRWEILLQVVILGRLDYVVEIIRQNLAIVWMMLVTVESLLASAGGLGFLIKNSDKFMNHGRILALQIIILFVGIMIDVTLTYIRKTFFKYTFK